MEYSILPNAFPALLAAYTMTAMPIMIGVLCCMAIAFRYYSCFVAAKVAALDDSRPTPAVRLNDGQNYHPTNKWVLFGHHFAAISGAGPLIGPVLAAQFGYAPGLLWIVIGVCLGGAVQDFLVMAASLRHNGRSLAQIAREDLGRVAGTAAIFAILCIVIIALAGLGKVVVMALGGQEVVVSGVKQTVPGSSWGIFTIAAIMPIALFIGLYMYKLRPGRVVEASLIGAILTLGATFLGGWVSQTSIGRIFNLTQTQVTCAMAIYGFTASVLPVWVLLVPRDYLASFLKIGTIALLVIGVVIANPQLKTPAFNSVFCFGGPVVNTKIHSVPGTIFPFLFITIMCGAISGFHALVASGTTSKMVRKESDARTIGYGAMLIEGMVGVVAMIAAAALPVQDYYAMNVPMADAPAYHDRILLVAGPHGVEDTNINRFEDLTREHLRGRTGGAVTLAVGMAYIFDQSAQRFAPGARTTLDGLLKYWYHFAIMFEALFILTTIDAGTRIGRFLLQEAMGKIHPLLGRTNWMPGAIVSTIVIVACWALFMSSGPFSAIWAMFGIANQMLAVIALAVVSAWLINEGRARYLWVTILPMLFVLSTTSTAAGRMLAGLIDGIFARAGQVDAPKRDTELSGANLVLAAVAIIAMLTCTAIIVGAMVVRAYAVLVRREPRQRLEVAPQAE